MMDKTKPYILIERGKGNTAAIHLVIPDGKSVDVAITRTEENAATFDHFVEKLKDGVNVL
jgi:hypothetical protein